MRKILYLALCVTCGLLPLRAAATSSAPATMADGSLASPEPSGWPLAGPSSPGSNDALPAPVATVAAAARPLQAIPALDLPRYMGRWHEIARFPNWFQKKCVAAATAEYTLRPDGRVRVVNRCRNADGSVSVAEAEGRRVGPEGSARLEVRFAPTWLSFLPFVWGKYWVVDLDPGYTLAAVGEPGRDYLWILSRTPALARADYEALVARLAAKGFDVTRLEVTGAVQ